MRNMNIDIDVPLLLDMPFQSSKCLEEIEHIKDLAALDLTMMQYYFFTCSHELAASKAAGYLEAENVKIRIGALLIFTFSHMAMGHKKEARKGRGGVEKLIAGQDDFSKESCVLFMFSAAKTVLHIPITETERRKIDVQSHHCNEGGRLMCCYILEQDAWNAGEWERVIGSMETALHMTQNTYPLITLYFYLSASESALHLKDVRRAETYFEMAWKLAEADGF